MKFNIYITGEFNNIKGLKVAQRYHMDIQCGACNKIHDKPVFIDEDSSRAVKIKELDGKKESIFNVIMRCKNCEQQLGIVVVEPEDQFEFEGTKFSPVKNDRCHVSTIVSDRAVVKDIDGMILDVLSNEGKLFENCSFSQRTVAEDDKKGHTIDILKFAVEVVQVH